MGNYYHGFAREHIVVSQHMNIGTTAASTFVSSIGSLANAPTRPCSYDEQIMRRT